LLAPNNIHYTVEIAA